MWFRILVLALGTFAIGTDGFVIAGILPDIAHELNISVDTTGQLVTAFALTYAVCAPILAAATGNIARRPLLLVSLGILALANILAALSTSLGMLLAARILAACGAAMYTPAASAVAAALAPVEKRGQALALVLGGLTVATVLGVPLGILLGTQFSWQMTFVFIAILCTLAWVGILALFPAVANPPTANLRARLALLGRLSPLITLCNTMLWAIGGSAFQTYLGPLLQNTTHLNGTGISIMFLLFGLAGVLGNALGGYGADRWGPVRTLALSLGVFTIALLALPLAAVSVPGAALMLAVCGISGWMFIPPQQHRLITFSPEVPGMILSLNSSAIYFGIGGGAAIGGLVLHFAPVTVVSWVGSVWVLIALCVLFLSARVVRRGATHPAQATRCTGAA